MRVLVVEPLGEEGLELLRAEHEVDVRIGMSREEFLAALPDYEALVVRSQVKVDEEAFKAAKRLIVVGRAGVGVDNIDLDAATRAGVAAVNAPTANTVAAAEHTLALIYSLARRIPMADASMRSGEWRRADFMGLELRGRTLGIVGLGKIGMTIAERARAMEMELLGSDPFVSEEAAAARGIELLSVDALLERADVVTLHVPLTRTTRGMIGAAELARMKPTALLVNVARGGVVDEAALAEALAAGRLGGAAVDVYENEPPRDSPLLTAPNTVLTPHLGASTEEAQTKVAVEVVMQILDVLAGRPARYVVNAPLVPPETAQALAPFVPLARMLGQFYAQFATSLDGLRLEVAGEIAAHDSSPLAAAALSGLLANMTSERVTPVNAPQLARERGIQLSETRTAESPRAASMVTLSGKTLVAGTVNAGEPRLARLGDYWVDMPAAPWMLVTRHQDRPGTMGRIGQMLGEADVNISAMQLGRNEPRGDALMILALDEAVPNGVAERIRADEAVLDLWLIRLD
ncbi:MAG TPA: phosphoglycerate dehydrogenase [Candidatus Limnocylindrales bacterium]|nr:phosphoglycerate dehydrogenase [Candidatus Limnocylindrales bacterium]